MKHTVENMLRIVIYFIKDMLVLFCQYRLIVVGRVG